jgi:ADP-ribose pyrophosphatase
VSSDGPIVNSSYPRFSETKEVFECPWFQVHEEKWENLSDLDQEPFYRIEIPNGVLVLALTNDGKIILVRQFRHAIRRMTLEFPAGTVDEGESPEKAAARELHEETRYRSSRLLSLGSGHLMVNRFCARGHLFLAQDCQLDRTAPTQGNEEVHLASPEEFKDLVLAGEFEHIPALSLLSLVEWKAGIRLVA